MVNRNYYIEHVDHLVNWADELDHKIGQAIALAAITIDIDFSNYSDEIQENYLNNLLSVLQQSRAKCRQIANEYQRLSKQKSCKSDNITIEKISNQQNNKK